MNIKSCLPSFGFFVLLASVIVTYCFFSWGSDIIYDKDALEQRANQYFLEKKYKKAYKDFINAAKLMPLDADKSRNYRGAANAAYELSDIKSALSAVALSLKHNKQNKNAINILNTLLLTREIGYKDISMIDKNIITQLKKKNKVIDLEYLGHQLFKKKQYTKSYEAFVKSANLSTNANDKSMRLVYAANALYPTNDIEKILHTVEKALKYKNDNQNAISILEAMIKTKKVSNEKANKILKKVGFL